ncbi:MAG TPA: hypothetical protein VN704_07035, partial [Verrucomicrobiae bacterium]|nr:hypothetical protein [Verrucomicrobiae bacterium]
LDVLTQSYLGVNSLPNELFITSNHFFLPLEHIVGKVQVEYQKGEFSLDNSAFLCCRYIHHTQNGVVKLMSYNYSTDFTQNTAMEYFTEAVNLPRNPAQLLAKNKELEMKNKELQDRVAVLYNANVQLQKKRKIIADEKKELSKDLTENKEITQKIQEENKNLQKKVLELGDTVVSLESKNSSMKSDNQRLKKEICVLKNKPKLTIVIQKQEKDSDKNLVTPNPRRSQRSKRIKK